MPMSYSERIRSRTFANTDQQQNSFAPATKSYSDRIKEDKEEVIRKYQSSMEDGGFLRGIQSGMLKAGAETAGTIADLGYHVVGGKLRMKTPITVGGVTLIGSGGAGEKYKERLSEMGLIDEEEPTTLSGKIGEGVGRGIETAAEMAVPFSAASKMGAAAREGATGGSALRKALLERYAASPAKAVAEDIKYGATVGGATEAARELPEFPGKGAVVGLAGLGAGVLGHRLSTGINRIVRGGTQLVPGGEEAFRQLQGRAVPSAGHLSENPLVDVAENIGIYSVRGFKPFQVMQEASEAYATTDVDAIARQYLGSKGAEELGGNLQGAIKASARVRRQFGNQLYRWLDELVDLETQVAEVTGKVGPSEGIDISQIAASASDRLAKSAGRNPQLKTIANWVFNAAEANPKGLSWEQAHALRSDLLSVERTSDEVIRGQAQGFAANLASQIDDAMKERAKTLSPELYNTWRLTNQFWKNTTETFGDRFIRSLLKTEPEAVLSKVTRKEMPGTIRKVRNIVLDPMLKGPRKAEAENLWKQVQGYTMLKVAKDATDVELQTQGKRALKILDKYGEDTLKELFLDPNDLNKFKSALQTLKITQGGIGKNVPWKLAVQFTQATALVGFVTGNLSPKALFFTIGPEVVRHLFTKESFIRWVAIGTKAKPGSPLALEAYSRLQAMYNAEKQKVDLENARIETSLQKKQEGVQP